VIGHIVQSCGNAIKLFQSLLSTYFSADVIAISQFLTGHQTYLCATDCTIMLCHFIFLLVFLSNNYFLTITTVIGYILLV
jgi:hypothetical protein